MTFIKFNGIINMLNIYCKEVNINSGVIVFKNLKDVKKSENFKWILSLSLGVMFVGMKIYQIKTGNYMF